MSLFGGGNDDVNDETLLRAIRKRLLTEVESPRDAERIVNNVYGGGVGTGQGGVMDRLGQAPTAGGHDDDADYFVDIMREDLPEINDATGKPKGWKKSVHRFKKKRATTGDL